jgi:hypothetical protein
MENQGWIKFHRKFINWEWYDDINTSRLFIHCLLKANHQDKKWRGITIKRGQFVTSLSKLAKESGLSLQQTRTSISKLKSTHDLTYTPTSKYTLITLDNFDKYQNSNTDSNTLTNTKITNEQHSNNNQVTTNKNDKEYKEYKEYNISTPKIENFDDIHKLVVGFYEYQYEFYPQQLKEFKNKNGKLVLDSIKVIDKLIRIDGYTLDDIKLALQSAVRDEFWKKQIISLRGLRNKAKNGNTKFDNLNSSREETIDEVMTSIQKKVEEKNVYRLQR